jgi:predicted metal-binding membrane protein
MTLAWVPMMATMMLPGAAPAIARRARERDGALGAPLFAALYAATWLVAGLAVYALYRPPGELAAAALVAVGGLYELTPFKRACRERCRARLRSGVVLGVACLGSSLGLMLILAGVGVMSMAWMGVIAAVAIAQKLLPPRPAVDIPLALALVLAGLTLIWPGGLP